MVKYIKTAYNARIETIEIRKNKMSSQKNWEEVLKQIHIMVSECPKVKGEQDKVVMDKTVLFNYLNEVSQCFYDMLDEFKLTTQQRKEAKYQMRKEYDTTVKSAETAAEDVYSASMLYTAEAITRLVKVIDASKRDMDQVAQELQQRMQQEKENLRANQKELQDVLFNMKDNNLYMGLISERRREIQKEKERMEKEKEIAFSGTRTAAYPAPEIKINKEYFEKMGLNEDGTPKPMEEKGTEAPEIKVDLNSNYFKWKRAQEKAELEKTESILEVLESRIEKEASEVE